MVGAAVGASVTVGDAVTSDVIETVGAGWGCSVTIDVLRSRPRVFLLVTVFGAFAFGAFCFPRVKVGTTTVTLVQEDVDLDFDLDFEDCMVLVVK